MRQRHRYLIKRAGLMVFSFYIVATLLFVLFRLSPGSPTALFIDPTLPQEAREALRAQYGLDQPTYIQYIQFLKSIVGGSFGISFSYGEPVINLILDRLPNTIVLTLSAVILSFIIGPVIGAFLAWNRNTNIDTGGIGLVLIMRAAPAFWVGMLGLMVFSFMLGWLPSGGLRSPGAVTEGIFDRYMSLDFLRHLILPLIVLTLYYLSIPALVMRNNMIDVLNEDFIEMNRAEGLGEFRILYRHAARNALLPVVHYAALAIGFAFGGSVVIERVFSWPGIGLLMWEAVGNLDYPLAQGTFLIFTIIILTMNFIADAVSVYIDPRTAETGGE